MALQPSEVAEFRQSLAGLAAASVADLERLWADWPWSDPAAARDAALDVVPDLTVGYADITAGFAADQYDLWRDEEGPRGTFTASPADVATFDQIAAGVRNSFGSLWGESPDVAAARVLLAGMVTRHVMHGGTDTITAATVADPQAVGWQRHARAGACKFCRMLAGRGGVYLSEKTARFASHDSCHCAASPSWDADAPEVPAVAYIASRRKQTPADRARVKAYLDGMPD